MNPIAKYILIIAVVAAALLMAWYVVLPKFLGAVPTDITQIMKDILK